MKKIFLCFVIVVFIVKSSFAQILISPKEAENSILAIQQQLLVQIYEVDKETLAKLSAEEKENYKNWVNDYNELVKESFKKFWKLHSNPIFLPLAQIDERLGNEDNKYSVFAFEPFSASKMQNNSDAQVTPYTYGIYITKNGKWKAQVEFTVMAKADTEMDFKFILHNLSKYLQAQSEGKAYKDNAVYDKEKNFETLSKKTLSLRRRYVG